MMNNKIINMKILRKYSFSFLLGFVFLGGCSTNKQKPEESLTEAEPMAVVEDVNNGDSDSERAMGLQSIHFGFDSFNLDSTNKKLLAANVAILKANEGLKIQIEGHCDQRGGLQYNIALGENRAKSVKSYIEDLGIASDRITVISYGKERLIDSGSTEKAHARNRRANFVITSGH